MLVSHWGNVTEIFTYSFSILPKIEQFLLENYFTGF